MCFLICLNKVKMRVSFISFGPTYSKNYSHYVIKSLYSIAVNDVINT
jgi:hypothetical protein